jgi:hypothetical protein
VSWPQAARSGSWPPRSKDRSTRSSWGKSTRAGRGGERARPAGGGGGGGGAPGCPPPEYSRLSSEKRNKYIFQGFGCETGLDPDSIRSVDLDPYSKSGSRRAKMTHKSGKFYEILCFKVMDVLF